MCQVQPWMGCPGTRALRDLSQACRFLSVLVWTHSVVIASEHKAGQGQAPAVLQLRAS